MLCPYTTVSLFESSIGNIIRDARALDPNFVPDVLPFRDAHLKEIASTIAYSLDAGASANIFVVGPPGTGKTASVKYVLRELSSYSPLTFQTYINCWIYRSRFSIISALAESLRVPVPRRGYAPDEAYSRIFERLSDYRGAVIVLDEVDRIASASSDVLYDFSRMHSFVDAPLVLITIANTENFLYSLDPRILSTLFSKKLQFDRYTVPQLKEILRSRARLALFEGTYDDNVLGLCAAVGWKRGGDARASISCLREAAVLAERSGDGKITVSHVRAVESSVKGSRYASVDAKLRPILDILMERGELTVSELYKEYISRCEKITMRAFRNYINELLSLGLIRVRRLPVRGNVRAVSLR